MIKIHLLIEEDYIHEFMTTIPKDKIKVIEENFEENKILLYNERKKVDTTEEVYSTYSDSMKSITKWLEEKE